MRTSTVAACVAAALLLAGCSDATSDPDATPSPETTSSGTPQPEVPATSAASAASSPEASALPSAAPVELGFDAKVLDRLAEEAEAAGSTCFLVARDGVVAGEW